jgi:hypothetical protein
MAMAAFRAMPSVTRRIVARIGGGGPYPTETAVESPECDAE